MAVCVRNRERGQDAFRNDSVGRDVGKSALMHKRIIAAIPDHKILTFRVVHARKMTNTINLPPCLRVVPSHSYC